MATRQDQPKRQPLKARPRPALDAKAIAAETSERYAKTLEYLGR